MKVEHKMLDVNEVVYDPSNPRITEYLSTYANVDDELIGSALQPGDNKYIELRQAIKTNDGIINPIIVNKTKGQLITIEGNTRLAIYRKFHIEHPNDERWQLIPAIVYEDMSSKAADAVRLQAHLVGVRNWTPYAKAKYLFNLHESDHLPLNELVEFCGGNKNDVLRNIEAYRQMEFTYKPLIPSDQFSEHKFSNFLEAQKPTIRNAMTSHGFNDKTFAEWVRDGKFEPRQELVRKLPQILANARSKDVFMQSGAEKAVAYIDRPEIAQELQNVKLVDLCNAIQEKINDIKLTERNEIRSRDESKQSIEDALEFLRNFYENEIRE